MTPIKIFIGYDKVESVAFHTLVHSIMTRATKPVSITPIALNNFRDFHTRARNPLQTNEFSFSRWLVPYLCGYEGHAIFMDCDMMLVDDISKLWDLRSEAHSIQCVKHNHIPKETTKYLGQPQTPYEKKNWSSVMIFNNEMCRALTPEYVNTASGLDLHQFKWLESEEQIGNLPLRWNFLVGYYNKVSLKEISNLHWTIGGPYFNDYRGCDYSLEWWNEFSEMRYCMQPEDQADTHYESLNVKS